MTVQRARLLSELAYAREAYKFWARQEHRLTRDEYAQKMSAERRVRELESAVARGRDPRRDPRKSSKEYAAGYKAGKSEARTMSARAARMYLDMVKPKTEGAHVDFDAGHRAAIAEKATAHAAVARGRDPRKKTTARDASMRAEDRPWRVRDSLTRQRYFFETRSEALAFVDSTSTSEITGEPLARWRDRLVVEKNQ